MKEKQIKQVIAQWQGWHQNFIRELHLNFRILNFMVENSGSVHLYFVVFGVYVNLFSECDGGWFIASISLFSSDSDRGRFLSVTPKTKKTRLLDVFLPWSMINYGY